MLAVAAIAIASIALQDWKDIQCEGEPMGTHYANASAGFSAVAPTPFRFLRPVQAGLERGAAIPLSPTCEAVIGMYGEPNSLEWRSLDDVVAWRRTGIIADDPEAIVHTFRTHLGSLSAKGINVRHVKSNDIERIVFAFRPGTDLVYTAHLATKSLRQASDTKTFDAVLRAFRLQPW